MPDGGYTALGAAAGSVGGPVAAAAGAAVGAAADLADSISHWLNGIDIGFGCGAGCALTSIREQLAARGEDWMRGQLAAGLSFDDLVSVLHGQLEAPLNKLGGEFPGDNDPTLGTDIVGDILGAVPRPPPPVHVSPPPGSGLPKMVMAGPTAKPQPVLIFYRPPTAAQKAATAAAATAANLTALDKAAGAATAARASAGIASSLGTPAKIAIGVVGTGVLGVWALLARRWLKGRR